MTPRIAIRVVGEPDLVQGRLDDWIALIFACLSFDQQSDIIAELRKREAHWRAWEGP